jgi:hypothetical protein
VQETWVGLGREVVLTLGTRYVVEKIMSHMIDAKVRRGFHALQV